MLMHTALQMPALTTVNQVAQAFNLSAAHLNKVAQTLAEHGYLQTVRGRSGGLRLARAPELIHLGEVVRVTEPDLQIAPCMPPNHENCPIYEDCVLKSALGHAVEAFLAELDKWTLADLVKRRKPLLLAIQGVRQ
jgi:Rrf2 family nitric oxide-sensitive transcriptional repressor